MALFLTSITTHGTGDSIIINCTGLFGFFAQERGIPILADPELKPVRGQILLVEAPSIKVAYGDYSHPKFPVYIYPRKVFISISCRLIMLQEESLKKFSHKRRFEAKLTLLTISLYLPSQDCVLLGGTYQPGQTDTTPK